MKYILVSVCLALLGLAIGSFCGATVWRLRARQLKEDKAAGEKIDHKEYESLKKLIGKSTKADRSICLHCHHQLAWYDLLPLVSWIALRGKCRYCHKPIGGMEPLIELGTAFFFVASYIFWPSPLDSPIQIVQLALWLIAGTGLIILVAYDIRWYLLPNRIVYPLIIIAIISAFIQLQYTSDWGWSLISLALGCVILSGIYFILYIASKGAWIGFGDIKLGLVLAFLVADWRLAFLTLFLANIIGCLVVLPGIATKKFNRYSKVPFGPMLIVACFITVVFGERIIDWYLGGFIIG